MEKVKAWIITAFTALTSFLGILAVPVVLLVGANITDYITGLMAAPYRDEKISSHIGFRGILKKICMWLLVLVGFGIDQLIVYLVTTAGINVPFNFLVASMVAIWLLCNELISILENIADIGVKLPPFLTRIVTCIKTKVEEKSDIENVEKVKQYE
ncbi:MAG: phage holin family protein [Oscillospiraceae bacterium]